MAAESVLRRAAAQYPSPFKTHSQSFAHAHGEPTTANPHLQLVICAPALFEQHSHVFFLRRLSEYISHMFFVGLFSPENLKIKHVKKTLQKLKHLRTSQNVLRIGKLLKYRKKP